MEVLKMNECYYHRSENGNKYEEFKIKSVDWVGDKGVYTLFYNGNEEFTHQSIYKRVGEADFAKVDTKDCIFVNEPVCQRNVWINDKELGVIKVELFPKKARWENGRMEVYENEFAHKGENYTRGKVKTFIQRPFAEESVDKEVINLDGTKEIVIGINEMLRLTAEQNEAVEELKAAVQKLKNLNVDIISNEDNGTVCLINKNGLDVTTEDYNDDDYIYFFDSSNVDALGLTQFRISDLYMNWGGCGIQVKRK